ncbi:MAG: hypothetical protein Q4B42_03585 [Oscillospiraceae bacterium]|nr:hypothetical protein [Oscillospiraceae bacterium]
MDYTGQLRAAHIARMKQQYLDAIEAARQDYEKEEREHQESARAAYVEKMTDLRDSPQQLRSLGLSGGVAEEDIYSIFAEYRARYEELKQKQREFTEEYQREVSRQQRLMDNAVAEYNARIALEDYKLSQKSESASSAGSGSSRSSSSRTSSSSKSTRSGSSSYGGSRSSNAKSSYIPSGSYGKGGVR